MLDRPRWTDWNVGQTGEMGIVPRDMSLADTERLFVNHNHRTEYVPPAQPDWSSEGPTTLTTVTVNPEPAFDKWLRRVAIILFIVAVVVLTVSVIAMWILIDRAATVDPSLWNTTEPLIPRN